MVHIIFNGLFVYWLGVLSAFFTAFYSTRLLYMTFFKISNSNRIIISEVEEASFFMIIPLIILTFASMFVGYIMKDLFIGFGVDTWNGSLFQLPNNCYYIEAEFLPFYIKIIPFVLTMLGIFVAVLMYNIYEKKFVNLIFYKITYYLYCFLVKKWYFDIIYNEIIVKNVLKFGYVISFKMIDRSLLELLGPLGIVRVLKNLIKKVTMLQSGLIYHYIFCMMIGLSALFLFLLFEVESSLLLIYFMLILYDITKKLKLWL